MGSTPPPSHQALSDLLPLLSRFESANNNNNQGEKDALQLKARAIELLIEWERQGDTLLTKLQTEFTTLFHRCSFQRMELLKKGKDSEGYQEELLEGTTLCRKMVQCLHRLQRGLQQVGTPKAKQLYLELAQIRNQPKHLQALLKMCDCTVQWGYVRCSALNRLMEVMDDPKVVKLELEPPNNNLGDEENPQVPPKEYFLYFVIETLAKFVHDEKTLGGRSGWRTNMHDKAVCADCWVVAMTLLMQALDQSKNLIDPNKIIANILSKYQWYTLFPTLEQYPATQFEQHFTMYLNLWNELHRMASTVVIQEGFSALDQRTPAKNLLQFDLGNCCTGLLECLLRMLAHGKNWPELEEPEQLNGILCGSFEFLLKYNLCWTHRQFKPQTNNLRRRARASLLELMENKASSWRKNKATSTTLEHCYRLACMLKDSTWSRFNEDIREDIQWKLLKTLLIEPSQSQSQSQDKASPEMQQRRQCLSVAIGYTETKCAVCWKTEEDLKVLQTPKNKNQNSKGKGKSKKKNPKAINSTNTAALVPCSECELRIVCSSGSCQEQHKKSNCAVSK